MNQKFDSDSYENNTVNLLKTNLLSRNCIASDIDGIINREMIRTKENFNCSIILNTFKQIPKSSKQTKSKFSLDSTIPSPSQQMKKESVSYIENREKKILSEYITPIFKSNSSKDITITEIKNKEKYYYEEITQIENLIQKINKEIRDKIMFDTFIRLDINADLIISHKKSNGQIFLGSNNYQFQYTNLHMFNAVFNIVGDYPKEIFSINDKVKVIIKDKKESLEIQESIVELDLHQVFFYVKSNEKLNDYNYLVDKIYEHFLNGDNILIHCQQGLVRSATLLLFFLRKYIFEDVNDANDFIGIKRKNARSPLILYQSIEKIIKKCI